MAAALQAALGSVIFRTHGAASRPRASSDELGFTQLVRTRSRRLPRAVLLTLARVIDKDISHWIDRHHDSMISCFRDGLSSRHSATPISARGVDLAATKQAREAASGSAMLTTKLGHAAQRSRSAFARCRAH